MSNKTATVTVRIEPEIKEKAEKIMEELGLPHIHRLQQVLTRHTG